MPAAWIVATFVCAGTLRWARGWLCIAVYLVCLGNMQAVVRRRNPILIAVRRNWRRSDTKRFDRVFLAIYMPLTFVQPAIGGLDAVRFRWTHMPVWTAYAGVVLFALATGVIGWAMAVNPHAETTVRIQTDRGHTVIDSGPYRFVRHPMYVGAMVMYPATGLMLGSVWALAISAVMLIALVWRTALEDRVLQAELPGYNDFVLRTGYRLVPGLW